MLRPAHEPAPGAGLPGRVLRPAHETAPGAGLPGRVLRPAHEPTPGAELRREPTFGVRSQPGVTSPRRVTRVGRARPRPRGPRPGWRPREGWRPRLPCAQGRSSRAPPG